MSRYYFGRGNPAGIYSSLSIICNQNIYKNYLRFPLPYSIIFIERMFDSMAVFIGIELQDFAKQARNLCYLCGLWFDAENGGFMQTFYFTSDRLIRRNSNILDFRLYKEAYDRVLGLPQEPGRPPEEPRDLKKPVTRKKNRLRTIRDSADLAATLFIAVFLCMFSICFFMI